MKKQIITLALSILILTTFTAAEDIEELENQTIEQLLDLYSDKSSSNVTEETIEDLSVEERQKLEQEINEEFEIFPEETINLTEQTKEIPGFIRALTPEQRVNVNLENVPEEVPEEIPSQISIAVDSDLKQIEVTHEPIEDPTLELWIDVEIFEEMEEHEDEFEAVGEFLEEERIRFEAKGLLNRILLFPIEHIGLRMII